MQAIKGLWTPTSRLYSRADEGQPRQFVLDCGIAWQNYKNELDVWQAIDLTPEAVPGGIRVRKVPYDLTLLSTGERRISPDRAFPSRYIRFQAGKFLANKTFTRIGNSYVWSSLAFDIRLTWENSRVKFDVIVKRNIPFDSVSFDVDKAGVDDTTLLAFLTNLKAIDSTTPEPIVRPLAVSLVAGVLTLGFDLTGMTFPVIIDPTLDLQVGAGANDTGHALSSPHYFSATDNSNPVGKASAAYPGLGGSARFTDVTVPQGSTIDVAYLTYNAALSNSTATCVGVIDAEDVDSGDAPTSDSDWDNEVKTTAAVAWNPIPAWVQNTEYQTPSIIAVIQELTDRVGWVSGNAINLFLHDEAQGSSTGARRDWYSYNGSTTKAPKAHFEYTEAAGGGQPYSARVQGISGMRTWGGF